MSTPPFRVLRVIARLNIGGPAIHVSLLAARLDPARYRTTLVYGSEARDEGSMRDLAEGGQVETIHLPELGRAISPWSDLRALARLVRLMRRLRPTIVHTHTSKAGLVGRLAARLAGVPIVVHTFHGHVFHGYFSPPVSRLVVSLERFAARVSDRIVTVSPRLSEELLRYRIAPAAKIQAIPLGFELQPYLAADTQRGRLRTSLHLPPDVPLVGIVGRLVPVKNHRLFLAAARQLVEAGTDARFVVVGDGEQRAQLEREAADVGLGSRVCFTGWRRDLPAVYADLDLLALTSVNEGTPVSVIEAMASGCPVVATRVGGVPDVISDGLTGRLVASGDATGLARAMRESLANVDRARAMARAARADVAQRFTAEALVKNIEALYQRLLTAKGWLQPREEPGGGLAVPDGHPQEDPRPGARGTSLGGPSGPAGGRSASPPVRSLAVGQCDRGHETRPGTKVDAP